MSRARNLPKVLLPLLGAAGLCAPIYGQVYNPDPIDYTVFLYPPEEPCCPESCMVSDDGTSDGSGCPPCEETGSVYFSISLGRTGFERQTDFYKSAVAPSFAATRPGPSYFMATSGMAHRVRTFQQVAAAYRRSPLTARREFRLWIAQEDITASTYTRAALVADPEALAEKIMVSGMIRQVLSDDRLTDINDLASVRSSLPSDILGELPTNSEGFVVRSWFAWDKGAKSSGLYGLPTGDALSYVVFYNPDAPADNGRLNIIHKTKFSAASYKTRTFKYHQDASSHDWTSTRHAGLPSATVVRETVLDTTAWASSRDFTRTRTVKEAALSPSGTLGALQTVSVTSENFDDIGGTSRLVEEIKGFGSAAPRTTRYGYYGDTADNMTLGRLKWRSEPDGAFVHFTYTFDPVASTATIVKKTPWKGYKWDPVTQPSGPTTGSCVVETATIGTNSTVVESKIGSQSVSYETETWSSSGGDSIHTRQQWCSTGRLITRTGYYPSTAAAHLKNRIKWRELSDGTAEKYSYTEPDSNGDYIQTVEAGAGSRAGITSGSRVVSTRNKHGLTIEEHVWHFDATDATELRMWVADSVDFVGRPTVRVWNADVNDYDQTVFSCCGIGSFRDRSGILTEYLRDDLKRVHKKIVTAGSRVVTTETDYNGLVTTVRRKAGALDVLVSKKWMHLNGEPDKIHAPDENDDATPEETTYTYSYPGTGGRIVTVTNPDNSTEITEYFTDGRVKSVSGTAVPDALYDYGTHSLLGGGLWSTVTKPSSASPTGEWVKVYSDRASRKIRTEYPTQIQSPGNYDKSEVSYYSGSGAAGSRGKVYQVIDADGVTKTFAYNSEGEHSSITETMPNGVGNRVITFEHEADDATALGAAMIYTTTVNGVEVSSRIESGDGYASREISFGRTTTTERTVGSGGDRAVTITHPDGTRTVQIFNDGLLQTTESRDNTASPGSLIASTTNGYDALGRAANSVDSRTGTTTYTAYTESGNLLSESDPGSRVTAYGYDVMGRQVSVDAPDTTVQNIIRTSYWLTGQVKAVWGDQTYATVNLYDEQGRTTELRTFRNWTHTNGTTGPDETTGSYDQTNWSYDPQRGWLATKRDDSNLGADYTYTAAGLLKTRQWARTLPSTTTRLLTEYGYDQGKLASVTYNDTTPDLLYTYDTFGRVTGVTRGGASHFTYNFDSTSNLRLLSEIQNDTFLPRLLTRKVDGYLRPAGYQYGTTADPDLYSEVSHAYDTAGRLSTVTYQRIPGDTSPPAAQVFTYGYDYTASGGYHVATTSGSPSLMPFTVTGPVHKVKRSYEMNRNALRAIANEPSAGGTAISSYTYGVNDLGQRSGVTTAGSAFPTPDSIAWGYNARGEVVSADATTLGANDRFFDYDAIGNRNESRVATATNTGGTVTNYFADGAATTTGGSTLNQYGAIQVAGGTPRQPLHDDDGNLLYDGALWYFDWDGENRLITARTATTITTPQRIDYAYDYLGRCFQRQVKSWNGTAWVVASTLGYKYDGWNRFAVTSPSNTWSEELIWGLDLSGTSQGAGGVGGLLLWNRIYGGGTWESYYPTYDGNGNVSEVLNASGGVAAHWEYDAFGNTTYATAQGAWHSPAAAFPYRFSTKPLDLVTGLYYYGYRFYDPVTGRWPSRDPIEEEGGVNLYGFIYNDGINSIDILGLRDLAEAIENGQPLSAEEEELVRKITEEFEGDRANIIKCCAELGETYGKLWWVFEANIGYTEGLEDFNICLMLARLRAGTMDVDPILCKGKALKEVLQREQAFVNSILSIIRRNKCKDDGSGIRDTERIGKKFTPRGKKQVKEENKKKNGGVLKCEQCGRTCVEGPADSKGVTPPDNRAEVDHIDPKDNGGAGVPSNGQILCKKCNRIKSNKTGG